MRELMTVLGNLVRHVAERDHELAEFNYEKLGPLLKQYRDTDAKFEQWVDKQEVYNEKSKL